MEELTKDEKKELRKQETEAKLKKEQQTQSFKKIALWIGLAVLIIGGLWLLTQGSNNSQTSSISAPAIGKNDIVTGNKDAKVTVTEYADFQCPACGAYHPILKQLLKDYGDKIYFSYRYFPLNSIHKNAMLAAQAAQAANIQGKFWEMHDMLYENQNKWSDLSNPYDVFSSYAKNMTLDIDKFKKDYEAQSTKDFINAQEDKGTQIGVNSTPTFFVNNQHIDNPRSYDEFKALIDTKLQVK